MNRWIAALAVVRALTVIYRGDELAGVLFLAGALAVLIAQWSPWFLAAGAFWCSMLMPHQTGSVVLFAWVAAASALFDGDRLDRVLQIQVVVVYGFAAVHKIDPAFLSGAPITANVPNMPYPHLVAASVIATEAFLAVACWRRWPIALPVAIVAHASFVAGMSQNPVHAAALACFNIHIAILVAMVCRPLLLPVLDGEHGTAVGRVLIEHRRRARRRTPTRLAGDIPPADVTGLHDVERAVRDDERLVRDRDVRLHDTHRQVRATNR